MNSDKYEPKPKPGEPVVLYPTDPSTNRAQRRAGHKQGVFVPNSKNRPARKLEDGTYAPPEQPTE